jgi:hypothetical protein
LYPIREKDKRKANHTKTITPSGEKKQNNFKKNYLAIGHHYSSRDWIVKLFLA